MRGAINGGKSGFREQTYVADLLEITDNTVQGLSVTEILHGHTDLYVTNTNVSCNSWMGIERYAHGLHWY